MRRGAKSRRKEGQEELHDLKWKAKVGWVGLSALQTYGSEKLAEGKGSWKKREEDFFAKGLRGTVPHRPHLKPGYGDARRARGSELAHLTHQAGFRLAESATGGIGSAPQLTPHNPLMRQGHRERWRGVKRRRTQRTREERRRGRPIRRQRRASDSGRRFVA